MIKYKSISEAIEETSKYVEDRMTGKITSLKTGLKKLDKCTIDGIEWNSTITIGGRPSVGKSAYSDCIVEGAFASNLVDGKPDFLLLDFNWELSSRVMLLRRLSARMKKTYKHIVSADNNVITSSELDEIKDILYKHYGELPITFCEEPLTVKQFGDAVRSFCEKHPGKKVLIRVDHTLLTRMLASDGGQVQMLLNLLAEANILKKELPVIFMFLTQINREFEARQEDGTDSAFPRQGDVYGGDAAAMFSETILLLNKPAKYGIRQYGKRGSDNSKLVEDDDLFAHIVKNRNSGGDMILHYKENFKHMSIKEQ
jgi:replicative DNA helicase